MEGCPGPQGVAPKTARAVTMSALGGVRDRGSWHGDGMEVAGRWAGGEAGSGDDVDGAGR
jgi:hypothetical protein